MYLITYKNLTVSAKMKCFSKKVFYIFCTTLSLLSGTTMHIQCIYYVMCMPVSLVSYHRQALLQTFLWIRYTLYIYVLVKVSLLGVDSLWGDCTFIPADWGSQQQQQQICANLLFLKTFHYKNDYKCKSISIFFLKNNNNFFYFIKFKPPA